MCDLQAAVCKGVKGPRSFRFFQFEIFKSEEMQRMSAVVAASLLLLLDSSAGQKNDNPVDPPFDTTRVLFSAAFNDHMVLQRAPQKASVFGTATPGASVTVTLTGPNYTYTSTPVTVVNSSDISLNGTWKVLLPSCNAGFGYTVQVVCTGCSNVSSAPATIEDVGFGDVFLCSGQSNS